MLNCKKIAYNSKTNRSFPTFNLICDLSFDDNDSGETSSGLNREIIFNENYNGKLKYASTSKYNENLSVRITLMKEDFSLFTVQEQRQVLSWLTSKSSPSFLDIYEGETNTIMYSILGCVTEVSIYKTTNNKIAGIVFTFESLSPFSFSALKTVTSTISAPQTIVIETENDDYESLIYPKITITENGKLIAIDDATFFTNNYMPNCVYTLDDAYYWKNGTTIYTAETSDTSGFTTTGVYIKNATTNADATIVYNNGTAEQIVIDGANKIISSNNTARIFNTSFSWDWLGLQGGTNNITVVGNCEITISWRNILKLGERI